MVDLPLATFSGGLIMTNLCALWLPILISTVFVFVASSVIHIALPWHKSEYPAVPREDEVMSALRPFAIPPGDYMMPRASGPAELRTPEFANKLNEGPVAIMTIMPNGPFKMGRNLLLWFIYCAIVGLFSAYLASRSLPSGAAPLRVIQIAGTAAFMGYAMALWQMSIWYRRAWPTTVRISVDGLVYALVTAGTLAWLWPG